MKDLTYIKHNVYQRISADGVLTRGGDLIRENINTIMSSMYDPSRNLVIKGGKFTVDSGWTFHVDGGSFYQQSKDVTNAWVVSQQLAKSLTVDAADPTDRYDLVQARYVVNNTNLQTLDIVDPATGQISQQQFYIDRVVALDISIKKGTAGAGICPTLDGASAATTTGTPILTTVDLSTKYKLKITVDSGAAVTVDCRGATPAATTIAEIITKINTAVGLTIATNDGSDRLKLTSTTTGEDSYILLTPPSSNDAINVIMGLSVSPNYYYQYQGTRPYFKLGEVKVRGGSANLLQSDLMDIDSVLSWTRDQNATQRTMSVYDMQTIGIPQQVVMLQNQIVDPGCPNNSPVWYNTATARWEKASAVNLPMAFYPGTGKIIFEGSFTAAAGLTVGPMYMDPNGNIIQTKTTVKIGFATSATACIIKVDNAVSSEYDIVISTQAEMDYYFPWNGGTQAYFSGKSVLLKANPPDGVASSARWSVPGRWRSGAFAYELRCNLQLGSFTKFHGDGFDQTIIVPYVPSPGVYSKLSTFRESAVIYLQHQGAWPKHGYTVQPGSASWRRGGYVAVPSQAAIGKITGDNGSSGLTLDTFVGGGFPQAYVVTEQVSIKGITFDGCGGAGNPFSGPNQYDAGANYHAMQSFLSFAYLVNSELDIDVKNFTNISAATGDIFPGLYMYLCRNVTLGRVHDNYVKATTLGGITRGGGLYMIHCYDIYIESIYGNTNDADASVGQSHGGGAFFYYSKNVNIKSVIGNNATFLGGGLYLDHCENFSIDSIRYCNATQPAGTFQAVGGAIYDNASNNVKIKEIFYCWSAFIVGGASITGNDWKINKIDSCWADNLYGGAQVTGMFADISLVNCYSPQNGGGAYVSGKMCKITAKNCYSSGASGGGIVLDRAAIKCELIADSCYSAVSGGGIFGSTVSVAPTVGHKMIARNCYTTGDNGGGIYLLMACQSCTIEALNCYINNTAVPAPAMGGGIWMSASSTGIGEKNSIRATNCYIAVNNNSFHYGGGVYILKNKSFDLEVNSCYISAPGGSTGVLAVGGGAIIGTTCSLFKARAVNCNLNGHTGATLQGGGLYIDTGVSPTNSEIITEGCYITHGTGAETALQGGGAYITTNNACLTICAKQCYISSSFAGSTASGGGAWVNCTLNFLTAEACYVSSPLNARGGGFFLESAALNNTVWELIGCYVSASAGGSTALGGGMFANTSVSNLTIELAIGCYATGNNVAAGGALYSAGTNLNMLLQNIKSCSCLGTAATKQGGGAWLGTGSLYNIFEGQWNSNVATTGPNVYAQTAAGTTGTRQFVLGTVATYDGGFAGAGSYPF